MWLACFFEDIDWWSVDSIIMFLDLILAVGSGVAGATMFLLKIMDVVKWSWWFTTTPIWAGLPVAFVVWVILLWRTDWDKF